MRSLLGFYGEGSVHESEKPMRGVLGLDAFWGYSGLRSYAFTVAGTVGQRGRLALAVAVRGVAARARARCERQAGGHDDAVPGYECRGAHGAPFVSSLRPKEL